jgi:hypothetical protein
LAKSYFADPLFLWQLFFIAAQAAPHACTLLLLEEFALSISNTGMLLLHAPPRCALTSVTVVMVMAEENIFGLRYRGVTRV